MPIYVYKNKTTILKQIGWYRCAKFALNINEISLLLLKHSVLLHLHTLTWILNCSVAQFRFGLMWVCIVKIKYWYYYIAAIYLYNFAKSYVFMPYIFTSVKQITEELCFKRNKSFNYFLPFNVEYLYINSDVTKISIFLSKKKITFKKSILKKLILFSLRLYYYYYYHSIEKFISLKF